MMNSINFQRTARINRSVIMGKPWMFYILLPVFSLVFINVAWVAEDAFITFRAVDNLLKGYGPVWNVGDRVQVFTHPLWFFLLACGTGLFKSHYWVSLALSYACLLGTLIILIKIVRQHVAKLAWVPAAFLALLLSRSFMDYSSSGLENPLVHLLLTGYVLVCLTCTGSRLFFWSTILYGMIYLTRPDAIFIVTPTSFFLAWQSLRSSICKTLALGLLAIVPVLSWEIFSLVYYGSFVPNTALAKVNIDYPHSVLFKQALYYFIFNLQHDPITIWIICLTFFLTLFDKNHLTKLLMSGVLLQILYIFYVGADYMLGRFLSSSMLMASIIFMLLDLHHEKSNIIAFSILFMEFILVILFDEYRFNMKYSIDFRWPLISSDHGVSDERGWYHQHLGLIPIIKKHGWNTYTHMWFTNEHYQRNAGTPNISISAAIGMGPWSAGEKTYWVDPLALAEPFLARLPAKSRAPRIGHYERVLPKGYLETLITGKNVIADAVLARLYDDVALAVRGPLWSSERPRAIWRLNTGYYKQYLHEHFDRDKVGDTFVSSGDWATPFNVPPAFSPFINKSGKK